MEKIKALSFDPNHITIERASIENREVAARLSLMAYKDFAYDLFGTKNDEKVLEYFRSLWSIEKNRFSYRYSYIAKVNSLPVGLLTCYPGNWVHKLIAPTIRSVFEIGKLSYLWYLITHIYYFAYFLQAVEAYPDEFYIGTLAVLPEYRNYGIGAKLIEFAVLQARQNELQKCTLLVAEENSAGMRFYERNAFKKVVHVAKPFPYYKVTKKFK